MDRSLIPLQTDKRTSSPLIRTSDFDPKAKTTTTELAGLARVRLSSNHVRRARRDGPEGEVDSSPMLSWPVRFYGYGNKMNRQVPGHLMVNYGIDLRSKSIELASTKSRDQRSPREVHEEACREIALAFRDEGFEFMKSKRALIKRTGDLKFSIELGTSRWNIRAISVALLPHISIESLKLAKWQKTNRKFDWHKERPFDSSWGFIHVMLHKILSETVYRTFPTFCEWNLAYDDARHAVVVDAVRFLRAYALPYFDSFLDCDQVIETLVCGDKDNRGLTSVPGLDLGPAVEYALCFGNLSAASAILRRRADLLGSLIGTEREQRFQAMRQAGFARSILDGREYPEEIAMIKRYWVV